MDGAADPDGAAELPVRSDAGVPGTVADSITDSIADPIADRGVPPRDAHRATELPVVAPDRYEIEGEHARGGLGVILRARDRQLARPIAIKELGDAATARARERFVREALITARLQHPGIVPVYDAGRWPDGAPYYAMPMVSGRTLGQEIAARPTLDARLALVPSVLAVAEAVGYAHAEGVIHRDLKPDNIMIGAFGETVVLDWGLAKDLRKAEAAAGDAERALPGPAGATRAGAVLGTPAYMAPEQARGEDVDERADVWAIGALLYHLLAAAPPFEGEPGAVIRRVASEPPPPLAARAPGAPRDLCAIADKAMAHGPAARYANAKLLAGDLSRFLTGQLVGARAYGPLALIGRWVRRHRAAVAVAAVLLAVLGATVALSIRRIVGERRVARDRGDELVLAQARSQLERDPTAALAWLAQYPPDGARWPAVRDVAAEATSRGIARHVWRGFPARVGALAVAPDGAWLAAASDDVVQLWDARSGRRLARVVLPPVAALVVSADGATVVAAGSDGSLTAIDRASLARRALGTARGFVTVLAAVPGRRAVVTGDVNGGVALWPLDGAPGRELTRHAGGVVAARVIEGSAGGDGGAAVVSFGGDLELRRAPLDGAPVTRLLPAAAWQAIDGQLGALAIARDGRALAAGVEDRVVRWALGMPAPIELGRHRAPVKAVAISDAGAVVSGAEDGSVTRWTGAAPRPWTGHGHAITALALGGEDRVASGDTGGDVRIWTAAGGEARRGHDGKIERLAFGADGTLYTASADRSVRAWPARPAPAAFRTGTGGAFQIAFASPAAIVATNEDGGVQWLSLATGEHREVARFTRQAYALQPLPGGRAAVSSWDGGIAVLGPTGDVERRLDHGAEINGLAASPDGARLASTGVDGRVRLWRVATGEVRALEQRRGETLDVAFAPDGRTLAVSGADHELHVHDLVGGGPPRILPGEADTLRALVFGAGGRVLYGAGSDGVVRGWDLATGARRAYPGHTGQIRTLALSADQRTLASGGADGLIVLWDLARDGRVTVLRGHTAEVRHVAFSPDGSALASAGWDGTARLWNLADGRMTVWRADDDKVQRVAFSPDGRRVATAGADGVVRLWPVEDERRIPGSLAALGAWIRGSTTAVIDEASQAVPARALATPP